MIFLDLELARRLEIASHPAVPEQGTETDDGRGKVELGIGGGVAVFGGAGFADDDKPKAWAFTAK